MKRTIIQITLLVSTQDTTFQRVHMSVIIHGTHGIENTSIHKLLSQIVKLITTISLLVKDKSIMLEAILNSERLLTIHPIK